MTSDLQGSLSAGCSALQDPSQGTSRDTEPWGDQWLNRSKYLNTQVKCSHLFHKVLSGSQTGVTGGGKEEPEEAGISLLISEGREKLSEENVQETSEPLGELRRLRVEGVVEKGIR